MAKLKPLRCGDCQQRLVVMKTERSVLPIEIPEGEVTITDEDDYDKTKHKSHLKNCKPMQLRWDEVKKKFNKQINLFAGLDLTK